LADHVASGTPQAQASEVTGLSFVSDNGYVSVSNASNYVEVLASGLYVGIRAAGGSASGQLQAQVSTVVGAASASDIFTASGTLLAQVSIVEGVAEALTPYVYMEGGELYDYMGPDDIYVIGELQPE
tara:strand:- start:7697 stop:8077 length:381 start_codon:yes stop_codon:yes gene_type:complete